MSCVIGSAGDVFDGPLRVEATRAVQGHSLRGDYVDYVENVVTVCTSLAEAKAVADAHAEDDQVIGYRIIYTVKKWNRASDGSTLSA